MSKSMQTWFDVIVTGSGVAGLGSAMLVLSLICFVKVHEHGVIVDTTEQNSLSR